MADITAYTELVPSQHKDKPRFMATLAALVQPVADISETIASIPDSFDLDTAVGAQLDVVGEWVGASRALQVEITDVYFAFDTPGLGFDEGSWKNPFDPPQMVELPDDAYRTFLRAKIASNHWDGTAESAVAIWDGLLSREELQIAIQDNCDMSMLMLILGGDTVEAVTRALISGGYLDLKPCGVQVRGRFIPSVPSAPVFGFDMNNSTIAGFDVGSWAISI